MTTGAVLLNRGFLRDHGGHGIRVSYVLIRSCQVICCHCQIVTSVISFGHLWKPFVFVEPPAYTTWTRLPVRPSAPLPAQQLTFLASTIFGTALLPRCTNSNTQKPDWPTAAVNACWAGLSSCRLHRGHLSQPILRDSSFHQPCTYYHSTPALSRVNSRIGLEVDSARFRPRS